MERIAHVGRAYLLFLLGYTLFNDKTGTRVLVVYLSLLSDLMTVFSYAWDAATLAYLYRQMGYANRSDMKQIARYMTLLEGWIYEHFCGFRPYLNMNYTRDMPHVYRWTSRRESGYLGPIPELQTCPSVSPSYVLPWLPKVFASSWTISSRVLRQFGRVQTIPNPPLDSMRASRGATTPCYNVMYTYLDIIWEAWDNHVLSDRRRSTPVRQPWDYVPGWL
ncbi:unnamed protein product [Camellia sinensis]